MARNGELERVLGAGVADGPHRSWGANRAGDLKEGRRPPERDFAYGFPHSALEIRAPDIQRKHKVFARVLNKADHRLDHFSCPGAIMPELCARKPRS
jgi:hypothetical protein